LLNKRKKLKELRHVHQFRYDIQNRQHSNLKNDQKQKNKKELELRGCQNTYLAHFQVCWYQPISRCWKRLCQRGLGIYFNFDSWSNPWIVYVQMVESQKSQFGN